MRPSRGFTAFELLILTLITFLISVIGIPNFIKFQARSKQSEAKANLKALYTAEKAYFQEKDTYSPLVDDIGFSPERNNRYQYNLVGYGQQNLQDRSGVKIVDLPTNDGIAVDTFKFTPIVSVPYINEPYVQRGPDASFVGGAQGNIDEDGTLDRWTISSLSRGPAGDDPNPVPAGEPTNEWNDVNR